MLFKILDGATANVVTNSYPFSPNGLQRYEYFVDGTFDGASVGLQGSIDGITWVGLISVTSRTRSFFETGMPYIRAIITGVVTAADIDLYILR